MAVDKLDSRLALAQELGATHVVNAAATPAVAAGIKVLTGGRGVDVSLDTSAVSAVLRQAIDALAPLGRWAAAASSAARRWVPRWRSTSAT